MNLTNYHSHTPYCDGRCNIEEFIVTAIFWGFTSYGVSPHSPIPYPSSCNMLHERVEEYISEMNLLKQKYEGKIELYTGMEIDFFGEEWNTTIEYFKKMPLDYRIASVHFIPNQQGEYFDIDGNAHKFIKLIDTHFGGDIRYVVECYFENMIKMIEIGDYDFIGHPDKISMNASAYSPHITDSKWYKDIVHDYFKFIAKKGVMLEVNTKAYTPHSYLFPNVQHLKYLKKLNIPLVVNSDAHIPSLMKSGYKEAYTLLKEAGYKNTMQLSSGKWVENPF
ncbi:MAG: histidinol-phosphatase [Bacteroidales bacterium]|nr:histidinol-phosphatase [Bacteroidales bacterium]